MTPYIPPPAHRRRSRPPQWKDTNFQQ